MGTAPNKTLDSQFFDDACIKDTKDQEKFKTFFTRKFPQAGRTETAAATVPATAAAATEEKRVDPDDGKEYTFQELQSKFGGEFSTAEIKEFWDHDCKKVEAAKP